MADPAATRAIRVFVSSTFRDMQAERERLVKHVFPELRQRCDARGVVWGEVDLRWGISDEEKAEDRVLPICLAEIRECRPFFLGLLGERYGWVPDQIPAGLLGELPWLTGHAGASVTELEILHGVLNDPAMSAHGFFYLRDPAYIATLPEDLRAEFTGSPEHREKLAALKARIRASGMPVRENYRDPDDLARLVREDLTGVIDRLFPEDRSPDALLIEREAHARFADRRTRVFVGRRDALDLVDAAARRGGSVAVVGEPGLGKTSTIAEWARRRAASDPSARILTHYVGASIESEDRMWIARRLAAEVLRPGMEEVLQRARAVDPDFDLRNVMPRIGGNLDQFLEAALARDGGGATIAIDGLEHLDSAGRIAYAWLPLERPGAQWVLSAAPSAADYLAERSFEICRLAPLDRDTRLAYVETFLTQYRKSLSPRLSARIADADTTGSPLFLRILLEELRQHGEHETLDAALDGYLSASSVTDLFERVLARCERDFETERPGLIGDAMALLWSARRGLTELEIREALGAPGDPIPHRTWSPVFLALEPFLANRFGLLLLNTVPLRQAVERRYLGSPARIRQAHRRLADYFHPRRLTERGLEEYAWQLVMAEDWERTAACLLDPAFLTAAWGTENAPSRDPLAMLFPPATRTRRGPDEVRALWALVEARSAVRRRDLYRGGVADPETLGESLPIVSTLLQEAGDAESALRLQEYARARTEQTADPWRVARALCAEVPPLCAERRYDEALVRLDRAEALFRDLHDDTGVAVTRGNRAVVLTAQGHLAGAMEQHQEVELLLRRAGDMRGAGRALYNQALLHRKLANPAAAGAALDRAISVFRDGDYRQDLLAALDERAELCAVLGDGEGALGANAEQAALARELGAADLAVRALTRQAEILAERPGRQREALAVANDARQEALRTQLTAETLRLDALIERIRGRLTFTFTPRTKKDA